MSFTTFFRMTFSSPAEIKQLIHIVSFSVILITNGYECSAIIYRCWGWCLFTQTKIQLSSCPACNNMSFFYLVRTSINIYSCLKKRQPWLFYVEKTKRVWNVCSAVSNCVVLWCSGYHVCFTRRRSRVRTSPEPLAL